ncbi:hypothetical protein RCO16_07290 [Escherichia coli]|nr:hypothetical protein [Escherichia coli]MED9699761.1 hypothetical protein [Escherichia coli]
MDKIPFDVLIHSENALNRALEMKAVLIKLTEAHAEQGVIYFLLSALC